MNTEVSKMDNQILSHTKYNCTYHIVFIPKYRWKVMYGKIGKEIGEILSTVCKITGIRLIKGGVCPNHRQSRWSSRMAVICPSWNLHIVLPDCNVIWLDQADCLGFLCLFSLGHTGKRFKPQPSCHNGKPFPTGNRRAKKRLFKNLKLSCCIFRQFCFWTYP